MANKSNSYRRCSKRQKKQKVNKMVQAAHLNRRNRKMLAQLRLECAPQQDNQISPLPTSSLRENDNELAPLILECESEENNRNSPIPTSSIKDDDDEKSSEGPCESEDNGECHSGGNQAESKDWFHAVPKTEEIVFEAPKETETVCDQGQPPELDISKLENALCRCCYSEGSFKNLYERYLSLDIQDFMKKQNVTLVMYSDMLQECFDIELAAVRKPLDRALCAICDTCIQRLRDATEFKRQVRDCERQFREQFLKHIATDDEVKAVTYMPQASIKVERIGGGGIMSDDDELSDHWDDNFNCGLNDEADDIPLSESIKTGGNKTKNESFNAKKKKNEVSPKKRTPNEASGEDTNQDSQAGTNKRKQPLSKNKRHRKNKQYTEEDLSKAIEEVKAKELTVSQAAAKYKIPRGTIDKKIKKIDDEKEGGNGFTKIAKQLPPVLKLQEDVDYKRIGRFLHCCKCGKPNLTSIHSLRKHIGRVHFNIQSHKCLVCSNTFRYNKDLIKHKFKDHNIDERFKCNACDKVFFFKANFTMHMDGFHMMGEKYKCDKCDFETFIKNSFTRHQAVHKSVKKYQCKFCPKSFKRVGTLLFHERIHTGDKRKVCNECGQAFVQKASLNYHMMKHHPEVSF